MQAGIFPLWEYTYRSWKTCGTSFGCSEQVTETSMTKWPLERLSWENSVGIFWSKGGGRKYSPPHSIILVCYSKSEAWEAQPAPILWRYGVNGQR